MVLTCTGERIKERIRKLEQRIETLEQYGNKGGMIEQYQFTLNNYKAKMK